MDQKKNFKSMYLVGIGSALKTAAIMGVGYFVILIIELIKASSNISEGFTALNDAYLIFYIIAAVGQFFKSVIQGFVFAGLFTGLYFKKISERIQKKSMYLYGVIIHIIFTVILLSLFQIAAFLSTNQGLIGGISFEQIINMIISILIYSTIFVYFFKKQLKITE